METLVELEQSVIDRYKEAVAKAGAPDKVTELAEVLGIKYPRLYQFMNGRQTLTFEILEATLLKFPQVNANYIIVGTGEALTTSDTKDRTYPAVITNRAVMREDFSDSDIDEIEVAIKAHIYQLRDPYHYRLPSSIQVPYTRQGDQENFLIRVSWQPSSDGLINFKYKGNETYLHF